MIPENELKEIKVFLDDFKMQNLEDRKRICDIYNTRITTGKKENYRCMGCVRKAYKLTIEKIYGKTNL